MLFIAILQKVKWLIPDLIVGVLKAAFVSRCYSIKEPLEAIKKP